MDGDSGWAVMLGILLLIGLLLGLGGCLGARDLRQEAIERNYAHYDSTTGQW